MQFSWRALAFHKHCRPAFVNEMKIQLPWMRLGKEEMHMRQMPSYCSGHVDNTADGEQKARELALPVPQDPIWWGWLHPQEALDVRNTYRVICLKREQFFPFQLAKAISHQSPEGALRRCPVSMWLCGVHESELSPLLAPGLQIKYEMTQMNRLKPFPQQG